MFKRILIANRGEIACRIIRSAHAMGVETVAVYSDADKQALHVKKASAAIHIGDAAAAASYLDGQKIIQAALDSGAQAIHPGYGFLSENPDFVDAVNAAGLVFIGPSADAIRAMGLKDAAKQRISEAGVPVVPGYHGSNQAPDFLKQEADNIGYPLLIKARAGGGGKGMRLVSSPAEFNDALDSAVRESIASFGDGSILLEKFIESPRHIEVQVFGDSSGQVVHLFERDCSLQRRHQKVIEEAPAPGMSDAVRKAMTDAAITAAKAINYTSAGTVEFIVDGAGPLRPDGFWFMEMNTRLQVEHPVTESILGIDLVEWQLLVAAGSPLPKQQSDLRIQGHSLEARLYAEDPSNGFLPVSGKLHRLVFDERCRVDAGVEESDNITPFYDPMIAKIIVHGSNRTDAISAMADALDNTCVAGTQTNLSFLTSLIQQEQFLNASMTTGLIDDCLPELLASKEPEPIDHLLACLALIQWPTEVTQSGFLSGFRLFGAATKRVTLNFQGEEHHHKLVLGPQKSIQFYKDESQFVNGDAPEVSIDLEEITPNFIRFHENGRRVVVDAFVWQSEPFGDSCVYIKRAGLAHNFTSANALTTQEQGSGDANTVKAPMTGVIRVVSTKPGQQVAEGDALVVLEAMKMETTLTAARDGVVEAVYCAPNDSVNDGDVLIQLAVESEKE